MASQPIDAPLIEWEKRQHERVTSDPSAVASVAANISEGYGRPSVADRTRFFSYALGSTREAILWYQAIRPAGVHAVIDDRITRLSRIRRMVLGLLSRLREKKGKKFDS